MTLFVKKKGGYGIPPLPKRKGLLPEELMENKKIIIIGGGVIGLGIGWQLAKAGAAVTIHERGQAGRGASWAAGGMLGPIAEAHIDELNLLKLSNQSLARYPEWVHELETETDMSIGYRAEGTLIIGIQPDDTYQLQHAYNLYQDLGLNVEWLSGQQAREIESALTPYVTAAIRCQTDHQVDNRLMVQALQSAYQSRGGVLHQNSTVQKIVIENGTATGVQTQDSFQDADVCILAAGCWSAQISGLPDTLIPPVRPVKGQMLALQMREGIMMIRNVIRTVKARYPMPVYLVPRTDGRLIVGATTEELGFDTDLIVGGIYELLHGAFEAVPRIYELPLIETWTGLRPGSSDNAPILGKTSIENLIYATGHYRNGILLTPITAYEISKLILTGETSETIAPFHLDRFSKE